MEITVIYYSDVSLELHHSVIEVTERDGRVIVPAEFKVGKNIVAICKGNVEILNKLGERILPD